MKQVPDIAPYRYDSGVPIRAVLERFNELPRQVGCVVDPDGVLIGTVTDGDIRRGLLAKLGLDSPVDACMNRSPTVLRAGEDAPGDEFRYEFAPVVDGDGRLVSMLLSSAGRAFGGTALIMAGGYGSRMGEMTRTRPKPLLPVDGKPILEHVLGRLESAGVGRIFVSTHYLSDQIEAFLDARDGTVPVSCLHETEKLGTAGALSLLPRDVQTPLIVINGDILTSIDFAAFRSYHDEHDLQATVAVARYEHQVPYGVVRHGPDGLFAGIEEKPKIKHFVSAGIYCFGLDVVRMVSSGERLDMPDLLNDARALGAKVGLFPIHEYWKDIGRPSDLDSVATDIGPARERVE